MDLRSRRINLGEGDSLWDFLPNELRFMILEYAATSVPSEADQHPLARCAAVNIQWRDFFEKKTFQILRLLPACMSEFDRIVMGERRKYVRCIWLRTELEWRAQGQSFSFLTRVNQVNFSAGLAHLFDILAKWEDGDACPKGLALELSAFSSVDPDHSMKDTVCDAVKGLDVWTDNLKIMRAIYNIAPTRRRIPLSDCRFPEIDRIEHCRDLPTGGQFLLISLPDVPVIKKLHIRRQTHQSFFTPCLGTIIKKLPRLDHLTCEPWRKRSDENLTADVISLSQMVSVLPPSLRVLSIFEDHQRFYRARCDLRKYTEHCRSLARQLADTSRRLQLKALSLSYMIDAEDFFREFWTPPPERTSRRKWGGLRSLTLTSDLIRSGAPAERITRLLLAAGRAAKRMPKLQMIEIYNGVGAEEAGIFRFHATSDFHSVTWESTWSFSLPEAVVDAWEKVAEQREARRFDVQVKQVQASRIRWPNCILPMLQTRKHVMHPITYCNMMHGMNRF